MEIFETSGRISLPKVADPSSIEKNESKDLNQSQSHDLGVFLNKTVDNTVDKIEDNSKRTDESTAKRSDQSAARPSNQTGPSSSSNFALKDDPTSRSSTTQGPQTEHDLPLDPTVEDPQRDLPLLGSAVNVYNSPLLGAGKH